MNQLKTETMTALKVFLTFAIVVGLVYPLMITAIAQLTMPAKANGSLITIDGKIVGSQLIGQQFSSPGYFQSRPSAVVYNAAGSGGSNLGPSSQKLMESVKERITQVRTINALQPDMKLPADMAYKRYKIRFSKLSNKPPQG